MKKRITHIINYWKTKDRFYVDVRPVNNPKE